MMPNRYRKPLPDHLLRNEIPVQLYCMGRRGGSAEHWRRRGDVQTYITVRLIILHNSCQIFLIIQYTTIATILTSLLKSIVSDHVRDDI